MSEEQEHWQRMIQDLQDWGVTLESTAEHLKVSVRTVSYWKAGGRPTGLLAVNLTTFHAEHRRIFHGRTLHGADEVKA